MNKVFAAVKALIVNGQKQLLVIKQQVGEYELWDLPGGRIEYGESPLETLKREIIEEVGLDVAIGNMAGTWWFYRTKTDNAQVVCMTWTCSLTSSDINIHNNPAAENIVEYRWVSKNEFLDETYVVSHESLKKLIAQSNLV